MRLKSYMIQTVDERVVDYKDDGKIATIKAYGNKTIEVKSNRIMSVTHIKKKPCRVTYCTLVQIAECEVKRVIKETDTHITVSLPDGSVCKVSKRFNKVED